MTKSLFLELHGGLQLHMWLFSSVENSGEILDMIRNKKLSDISAFDAEMILSTSQIAQAATIAVHREKNGKMRSKNVYTEILVVCMGDRNVKEALETFSIGKNTRNILFVSFSGDGMEEKLNGLVKGKMVELSQLREISNFGRIKAQYGISEEEESMEAGIMSRIAIGSIS